MINSVNLSLKRVWGEIIIIGVQFETPLSMDIQKNLGVTIENMGSPTKIKGPQ